MGVEGVGLLIQQKANINEEADIKGYQWYTPLACAIDHEFPDVLKYLLEYQADVNIHEKDIRKKTESSKSDEIRQLMEEAWIDAEKKTKLLEEELVSLFEGSPTPK